MEITIKINERAVSVEVSYEAYEYLCESDRKAENLSHQKRRHWDGREFDEYIIATECTHIYAPTPEEILCHRETMCELMAVLASCTEQQRQRFLLYALEPVPIGIRAIFSQKTAVCCVEKTYPAPAGRRLFALPTTVFLRKSHHACLLGRVLRWHELF